MLLVYCLLVVCLFGWCLMLITIVNSVDDFIDLPGIKMLFRCGVILFGLVCYLVLPICFGLVLV